MVGGRPGPPGQGRGDFDEERNPKDLRATFLGQGSCQPPPSGDGRPWPHHRLGHGRGQEIVGALRSYGHEEGLGDPRRPSSTRRGQDRRERRERTLGGCGREDLFRVKGAPPALDRTETQEYLAKGSWLTRVRSGHVEIGIRVWMVGATDYPKQFVRSIEYEGSLFPCHVSEVRRHDNGLQSAAVLFDVEKSDGGADSHMADVSSLGPILVGAEVIILGDGERAMWALRAPGDGRAGPRGSSGPWGLGGRRDSEDCGDRRGESRTPTFPTPKPSLVGDRRIVPFC